MRQYAPYDYYCPCDLKINFCDINCCCDVDCAPKEIKRSMRCEEHEWSVDDYVEESALQPCPNEPGLSLFCIVEGHKKRKAYKERTLQVDRLQMGSVARYKWPNRFGRIEPGTTDMRDSYKFDDTVFVWNYVAEQLQEISE